MGWANKLIGWTSGNGAEVNSKNALLTAIIPNGASAYAITGKSGIVAAAAIAGGALYAMRVSPGSGSVHAYIDSIRIKFTTVTAFTTPVTATRSLVVTRGSGAAASGGTAITVMTPKDTAYAASQFDTATGGDVRIATTGVLTTTSVTFESTNFGEMTLIHAGAAGGFYEEVYEFSSTNHPIELAPSQLLAVRVGPSAMDAAGTFVLGVEVFWHEGTSYAA